MYTPQNIYIRGTHYTQIYYTRGRDVINSTIAREAVAVEIIIIIIIWTTVTFNRRFNGLCATVIFHFFLYNNKNNMMSICV